MRKPIVFVAAAALLGVVLAATVFRDGVAKATGLGGSAPVTVVNTPDQAVPVREQAQDGGRNIKVHEQGTANVHVTNASLPVATPSPVTGGGGTYVLDGGDSLSNVGIVASALVIHMTAGINGVTFEAGNSVSAGFVGPIDGGNADVVLALDRPIQIDTILCDGGSKSDSCAVSWVGNQP
jgi:hypothetical protein